MTSGSPTPAFRTVFESEYGYVRSSVARMGIRPADVPDVVHDVFVVVHEKLGEFDTTRPVRPWLFGIAFRVAVGVKRKMGYFAEQLNGDESANALPSREPSPEDSMNDKQRREILSEAMDLLDDDKRAVFVLHDLDGTSMPMVAEALEVPLNTAYSRLRLAREVLRARLARRGLAPEAA